MQCLLTYANEDSFVVAPTHGSYIIIVDLMVSYYYTVRTVADFPL